MEYKFRLGFPRSYLLCSLFSSCHATVTVTFYNTIDVYEEQLLKMSGLNNVWTYMFGVVFFFNVKGFYLLSCVKLHNRSKGNNAMKE